MPGLIAAAVASQGSIDNVAALAAGRIELGLSQADVARDAFSGQGAFAGKPALTELRSIANLFAESLHVVVRKESPINGDRRSAGQAGRPRRARLRHASPPRRRCCAAIG